jgi:hypothetical protein
MSAWSLASAVLCGSALHHYEPGSLLRLMWVCSSDHIYLYMMELQWESERGLRADLDSRIAKGTFRCDRCFRPSPGPHLTAFASSLRSRQPDPEGRIRLIIMMMLLLHASDRQAGPGPCQDAQQAARMGTFGLCQERAD